MGAAIRKTIAQGYNLAMLRADVLAGLVVGVVALPLSMALAIAVGVAPQHGLYTAIVGGIVVALTGGSKFQITGPTAAFVVILAPIVTREGLAGLLTAGLMAGVMLVAMGVARLGRMIQFIPHPVTTGFTAGIATVIATLQIKDALALPVARMPETFLEKLGALWAARGGASLADFSVTLATLGLLLVLPERSCRNSARARARAAGRDQPGHARDEWARAAVARVSCRDQRVSLSLDGGWAHGRRYPAARAPLPMLPWGAGGLTLGSLNHLASAAFAIAMLGAIESLLSATIADGMTGKKHDPDAELIGLGLGNIIVPFFGGIAATGALARTATNIKAGARSPIAAVVHSLVVLLAILALAPLVAYVPMATLAGLLLLVAWNMSEVRHFLNILRIAPKSDVLVLLLCFALTVLFDMVIAVSVGVVLAALLFMRRTAELTHSRMIDGTRVAESEHPSSGRASRCTEIDGPLFFGAAQKRNGRARQRIGSETRVIVLALGHVLPSIDATGFVALESAISRLTARCTKW